MNPVEISRKSHVLYVQRNVLLMVTVIMLASNLLLAIGIFSKSEKVVIVPALKEGVAITGVNGFNESYIEQMTIFFSELLFDLTPGNIGYKRDILLRHVYAPYYKVFTEYYKEEESKYKKYSLSSKFDITGMKVLKAGEKVEVKGLLSSKFGHDAKKQEEVIYKLGFKKSHGRLLIKSFERVKK